MSSHPAPTTLTDLPAEVRNHVYHYALISEEVILVSQRRGKIAAKTYCSKTGCLDTPGVQLALNLLRGNSMTKCETAAVFYGNNAFLFANTDHFTDWVRAIGKNSRTVRRIGLQYVSLCHPFLLKPLGAQILGLSRLEIPHNKHYCALRLAGDLMSFVKGLLARTGKGPGMSDVLDVLKIHGSSRTARVAIQWKGGEIEAYERDVKAELARLLS
ncbi:hypothetical protein BST61_g2549 [Cercospora zeina]